jgi:flagellar protein FlaG
MRCKVMDVGKILLTPSDVALTFRGTNIAAIRPTVPAGDSGVTKNALDSPQGVKSAPEGGDRRRSNDKVKHLIEDLAGSNRELSIVVDPETRKIVVKVLNSETHEVIREIPPEDALHLAKTLKKLSGALVDEVA